MSVRRNTPDRQPSSPEAPPLISLRTLVIICVAVAGGIAAAILPALAVPIAVGVGIAGLLVKIIGD
jgi:hypothetical protein